MERESPEVSAVAVAGNRIVAMGTVEEVMPRLPGRPTWSTTGFRARW